MCKSPISLATVPFTSVTTKNDDDWTDYDENFPVRWWEEEEEEEAIENSIISMLDSPAYEEHDLPVSDEAIMEDVKNDPKMKRLLSFTMKTLRSLVCCCASSETEMWLEEETEYSPLVNSDARPDPKKGPKGKVKESLLGSLWDSLKKFLYKLKESVKSFWNLIIGILKKVFQFLKGIIKSLFERVGELLKKFSTSAKEAAKKQVSIVTELLKNQIEEVLNTFVKAYAYPHAHRI